MASHNIYRVVGTKKVFDSSGLSGVTAADKPRMQRSGQVSVLRYAHISYIVATKAG